MVTMNIIFIISTVQRIGFCIAILLNLFFQSIATCNRQGGAMFKDFTWTCGAKLTAEIFTIND